MSQATSIADLKKVSGIPDKARDIQELSKIIAGQMKQINSVIAGHLTPEKMARIALNELRTNDYLFKIALQNPASFVNAVVQASHLGLEIGGALGQAYLVPFKNEIKMMPGYRGLISLSRRSGEISSINAEIAYENDVFDLQLGIETKVIHKPLLKGDRGKPLVAYMVAHFKDGGHHLEWMTVEEVMKIKQRSSAVKSGRETPWDTDTTEMIKKTVVRRGWKYLPMSIEMQRAEVIDSANDQGKQIVIDNDSGEMFMVDTSSGEIIDHDEITRPKQIEQQETTNLTAELLRNEVHEEVGGTVLNEQANTKESEAPRQTRESTGMDLG